MGVGDGDGCGGGGGGAAAPAVLGAAFDGPVEGAPAVGVALLAAAGFWANPLVVCTGIELSSVAPGLMTIFGRLGFMLVLRCSR